MATGDEPTKRPGRFDRPAQRPGAGRPDRGPGPNDGAPRDQNRDRVPGQRPDDPRNRGDVAPRRSDGPNRYGDRRPEPAQPSDDRRPQAQHRPVPPERPRGYDGPPPDWVTGQHAAVALLQDAPQRVREVVLWSRDPRVRAQVLQAAEKHKIAVFERPPPPFDDPANPQGVAVRVTEFAYADLDAVVPEEGCPPGSIVLVLDSITDPRNLGAILRSAAFFGARGVILPQDRAAGITAVVERISRGATATLPVVRVVNLARTLELLRERGVFVVGTGLEPGCADLATHRFAAITAVVLGAEGTGVRPLVRKKCDEVLKLTGSPAMQSLNVSAFATLVLHTARGQLGWPAAGHLGG